MNLPFLHASILSRPRSKHPPRLGHTFPLSSQRRWQARTGPEPLGEAAAYGYPDAPLPEAELTADWFAWLFFVDDHEEGTHGSAQKWTDATGAVHGVLEQGLPTGPLADTRY